MPIIVVKSKTHPSKHIIVVKSKTHPSMHIIVVKSKIHPSRMHIIVVKYKKSSGHMYRFYTLPLHHSHITNVPTQYRSSVTDIKTMTVH
jgi:hypothetical protein